MRIFHTADWHLGRMLYGRSLLEDQQHFIETVFLPAVAAEKPDLVLIAGDIYDRKIAPAEAIRLFDKTLTSLAALGCTTGLIAGNHDAPERIAIMKDILKTAGIYIAATLEDAAKPLELEKDGERLQVFLLPYFDTATARDFFHDETLKGESACMQRAVEHIKPQFKDGYTKILCTHCFVTGSFTSDSESTIFVGGSGEVTADSFADFDYVALGHLHGSQKAGKNGRYSGSPLKYSLDETRHKKAYTVLTISGGRVQADTIPILPLRDVVSIEGFFADLMRKGQEAPCQDYAEVVLKDESPILLAAEQLRPYYPNLLSVQNHWLAHAARPDSGEALRQDSEITIFSSFMKDICQTEAEESDLALFQEILEEVKNKA